MNDSLLERGAAVAEEILISRLTLKFASRQIVIGMNARSPFLP